ncbi:MAG: Tyrosine-tRNA ligase [Candidatus Amesbacteria bacterium GW2011_GWA2_42_12]|uniref:Tyrosine--tRNA ligase n=1 Tax=Candidatus Amesbacteria bacterium GW2011_GWA2_42_12 TaxID=1618356 RepID=A0A0G0Y6M7_9BACT|nr:MAG: Tyrosine-tRNA ligase [Candidatus Amesbacteria bacterium GW2011_GWA2_42_12]
MDKIEELLTRGVANIIPGKAELEKVLRSSKKLNIFLGVDPTAPRIHLGHGVNLRKLQQFVELGHKVTFLIGDFTTKVGDSSDKESERPILADDQIEANWQTYKQQASKILDFSKAKVVHNSDWLSKLNFSDVIKLCQQFTLNDYISREIMKKKLENGVSIRLDEVLYPIMQGYDSYFMDTDIQVGAADQTFNMQAGRSLQKKLRNKDSLVLVNQYLTGTDGRKMSKSWGNAIWLDDSPNDMYGKVMSIKDELIPEYFTLATELSMSNVQSTMSNQNPMEIKKKLALQIVTELHSDKASVAAQEYFENTFQQKQTPQDISTVSVTSKNIIDILVETQLASSKSEAKRLVEQKGVKVNNEVVATMNYELSTNNSIISVGSRKFVKVELKNG